MKPQRFDAIVVGAGPAGASCARALRLEGVNVCLLDKSTFPREKLCAGWVTPDVFERINISAGDYPRGLLAFRKLQFHYRTIRVPVPSLQYSIRRFEFDDFLVSLTNVPVRQHEVRKIDHANGTYVVDDTFQAPVIIGAGGTRCPVYRTLFRTSSPRADESQIVALEKEIRFSWDDPRCHLFFFDNGLSGYSWYVPKAGNYLNCGVGGMAEEIKRSGNSLRFHWEQLTQRLGKLGVPENLLRDPKGYSYFMRAPQQAIGREGAFIIGDSAGLATRDLGEGIGPAVHSGYEVARAIVTGGRYELRRIYAFSPIQPWLSSFFDRRWKERADKVQAVVP